MSIVSSRWRAATAMVCGLIGALWMNDANAQPMGNMPGNKPVREKRGRLHSYFRSLENAKNSNMPFEKPEDLDASKGTIELKLTTGRFKSRDASAVIPLADGPMPEKFELLCYNGKRVGPTIRVKRGTSFKIHVKNALHGDPDPGVNPLDTPTAENVHGLCTTNLHTHGLHVSPSGDSDNIFRQIEPGDEFTFNYTVGPDHPSGTFWYHPHKHGSTAYQLSNGLSGALIVYGSPEDKIFDLDEIPQIKEASEKVLVLQSYTFGTYFDLLRNTTVGFIDGVSIYNADEKNLATCGAIKPDPSSLQRGPSGSPRTALAVNGILNARFDIAPGEIQRWRVVHGGWDIQRQFAWYEDDGKGGVKPTDKVQFWEIALDGLATGRLDPLATADPLNTKTPWKIAPGQRSDILVKAPALTSGTEATYYLMVPPPVPNPNNVPATHVAKLVVSGMPRTMDTPSEDDLKKCVPFQPIEHKDCIDGGTIPTANFGTDQSLTNTLSLFSRDDTSTYTLNSKSFHALAPNPIQLTLGTAQEWILKVDENSDSGHPYHIHVNPFQVVDGTDANGQPVPIPKNTWRDTFYVDPGFTYTIRSRYKDDIEGLSVLHCHILDHEDQGMMRTINLIKPQPVKAKVAGGGEGAADASMLKAVAIPSPALRLPDAFGKPRDLAEFRGKKVALVFYREACFHCADQLGKLVLEARGSLGRDAEVVAISSDRIKDPTGALKALGVTDSDRFHLLIDSTRGSFRDFGCLAGKPQHGLFLIDPDGMIRWSYVGETPFADPKLVVERIRDLGASGKDASRPSLTNTSSPSGAFAR